MELYYLSCDFTVFNFQQLAKRRHTRKAIILNGRDSLLNRGKRGAIPRQNWERKFVLKFRMRTPEKS